MSNSELATVPPLAEDFGTYLRRVREAKGIALADVALATKIPEPVLQRLEAGKLDELPAEVFVRGFIRAYARMVGADGEEALRRLNELLTARREAASTAPETLACVGEYAPEGRGRVGVALVVLLILMVATLAVSLLLRHPTPSAGGISLTTSDATTRAA